MPPRLTSATLNNARGRANLVLYGTIGLCTYTSWRTITAQNDIRSALQSRNDKRLKEAVKDNTRLQNNFVCSRKNLSEGRYHTLISSIWNHGNIVHFLGNMLGLWSFGRSIAYTFGARTFMAVFYGGGLVGNLLCLGLDKRFAKEDKNSWTAKLNVRQRDGAGFIGSSGGVCAIMAATACLNPWGSMIIGIMFIPVPVPNVVGALGFAGFSAWAQNNNVQENVAHLGHLGGLLCGFAWFVARFRGLPLLR